MNICNLAVSKVMQDYDNGYLHYSRTVLDVILYYRMNNNQNVVDGLSRIVESNPGIGGMSFYILF